MTVIIGRLSDSHYLPIISPIKYCKMCNEVGINVSTIVTNVHTPKRYMTMKNMIIRSNLNNKRSAKHMKVREKLFGTIF